jgi:hypothetical protein
MDRRIFFCGGAAIACLVLAEFAGDHRGIALAFAGVYVLYTLLFGLDDLSRRRAAANAQRRRLQARRAPSDAGEMT